MRVSYNWLKEFVDIAASPQELAETLTAAGIAVETVEERGKNISRVYTGLIKSVAPHPNADRLAVCQVDCGRGEDLQIVTGATNIRAGQIVPVALEGARLAGGMVIKRAKFRGLESRGMLCAADELGVGEDHEGILILPPDTPVGRDVKTLFGLEDAILELDLTPNRGDCLSVYGVAREVAAVYNLPLRRPQPQLNFAGTDITRQVSVIVEEPELCRRYVARMVTGIKIGQSPLWMQNRLYTAGMRPINAIVDVTNYVMLELGQPQHAFDAASVADGRIIVRRAGAGERLVTLDNAERELDREMLLIADPEKAIGIAGVMGGLNSEVTDRTTTIVLESAYFDPASVRRTARKLNLRSEASSRFERSIDISGCALAADRAVELMVSIGAGVAAPGIIDVYPHPPAPKTIIVRPARVNAILGIKVPTEEIKRILSGLDFNPQGDEKGLAVTVPAHRSDIGREIDLVEEVARLHGYDRIPETLPYGDTTYGFRTAEQEAVERLRMLLAGLGLSEVVTYSFVDRGVFDRIRLPLDSELRRTIDIANPLSDDQAVMRTLLFPGLVQLLARNFQRRNTDAALFEMATVFRVQDDSPLPAEQPVLAVAAAGQSRRGWNKKGYEYDFFFLKGVLEQAGKVLNLGELTFKRLVDHPSFHPGRSAAVYAGQRLLGVAGELHPDVLEAYDLQARAVACEFDLAAALNLKQRTAAQIEDLPRYPGVDRDLAVVLPETTPAAEVMDLIAKKGGAILHKVTLFDVYKGKQIESGWRSLAFSLEFQAPDRTLTDQEVNKSMEDIKSALASLGGKLRQ
ncbi:phenylalanine--tRNA ligase subunit beta [Desulforudis sp. 1088]|uniref:phenylalanine--tRNA ligase subunit beta n=1 Tax=unclassified Candidatus Desulforudis TaxID=2635950 RepID=UPI003CE4DE1C